MGEDYTLATSIGFLRRDGRRQPTPVANTDDNRRRYVLAQAQAALDRAARERAEQEGAKPEEVFDLDAYLRQFPKPLYPRCR